MNVENAIERKTKMAAKRAHRDAQFPVDLAHARALGKRLVEKAMTHI